MANFDLKDYVPVNERLEQFHVDHPQGRIVTEMVSFNEDSGLVIFKAAAFRNLEDAEPSATGHAYEREDSSYINKTSFIENGETSAVGRALAMLGYEIKRGIASREEMGKVERMTANGGAQKPHSKPQAVKAPIDPFDEKKKECGALFRELNRLNDSIKWNGDTIDGYVQSMFEVNGIEDLSLPTLTELIADLETRRKTLAQV